MRHLLAALALMAAGSLAPGARADDANPWQGQHAVGRAALQPLGQVLRSIEQEIPGRALDARKVESEGRAAYSVKWLGSDGKVRVITVDAATGRIDRIR